MADHMARRAATTMELRLKIEERGNMFYVRADAKNRGMSAMYTVDVAGKVGRDDSVDRHSQSGTRTIRRSARSLKASTPPTGKQTQVVDVRPLLGRTSARLATPTCAVRRSAHVAKPC